jgi:hypothetical protein
MKTRFTWAVLVLGAFCALPQERLFAEDPAKGPRISISPESFDFGPVLADKQVSREFVVRNVGSADLSIEKVSTSCGCTIVEGYSSLVKPGASTVLRVKVTMPHNPGHLQKSVLVKSNDPTHATVELKVEATVSAPTQ